MMGRLVGGGPDLDDLVQVALEQILRSRHRFEGRAEFSTFAYRICAHVAIDHWRWYRRFFRRFTAEEPSREPADPRDAGEETAERERARRLHAILEHLDTKKRLVLALAYFEELPSSQIAEILGIPEPTVRSRLRLARNALAAKVLSDPFFRAQVRR
jgi:RNA polymerase sigma-70 factor (ECF subfamily)